jgi:hypothetical protein
VAWWPPVGAEQWASNDSTMKGAWRRVVLQTGTNVHSTCWLHL